MNVEEIMVEDVVTVKADATVREAAKLMNTYEIGCLIVVDKREKPVGIVTERDMLKRVVVESRDSRRVKVPQIMSKPLIITDPEMNVEQAARLMFMKRIKKLPVVLNGHLVGLVTLTDIARSSEQMVKRIKEIVDFSCPKRIRKVVDFYV